MDFIEQLFHVSPDNGSGLTEAAIVVALIAVVCLFFASTMYRKRRPRNSTYGQKTGSLEGSTSTSIHV
jgi:hypothetical protein